jgi:integrase/recombinase XerD
MTPLREKMIKAMELRNFAKNTQRGYLGAVKGFVDHYRQSPDKPTKDEIEDYLLYLKNGKGNTTGSCGAVAAGLRFFYTHVVENSIPFDYQVRRKNGKLPTVLSQEDIWKLINATQHPQPQAFDFDTHGVVKGESSLQRAFFPFRIFMGTSALSPHL